jgi:hypothetical protein
MTKWSHLRNARHIDAVIANLHSYPTEASRAYQTCQAEIIAAALDAAIAAARDAAWYAARDAAWYAELDAAWTTSWSAALDAARTAARYSILALVAYDYCDRYLTMTSDQLQVWGALNEDPAAILLIPYVTFLEHATSKETA